MLNFFTLSQISNSIIIIYKLDSSKDAKDFLSVTREIIDQQIKDRSTDVVCEIESVNEDGTLNIPKALQPYMGGKTKIELAK